MKKPFTFQLFAGSKKTTFLALTGIMFVISILFIGCYQFRSINQPSTGFTNSYFDVPIVAERDEDPGLGDGEWANTLQNIGLFGVMIPNGWTVDNSIPYTIISKNPDLNNTGFLVYDFAHTKTLQDSIPALPGYYWWGAVTDRTAELTEFDSLYFTPRIRTNHQVGNFFLRYAIGDKDYWDRNPADQYNYGGGLSDPIQITITSGVGVDELLSKANIAVYPNPTEGILNVKLNGYKSEVISIRIFNSKGQVVLTDEILKSSSEFNLTHLSKGVYIVELQNGTKTSETKIVLK
jgi:hypothetical protein